MKTILFFLFILTFGTSSILAQDNLKTIKNISFNKVLIYEFDPSPDEPDFRKITQHAIEHPDTTNGLKNSFITKKEQVKLHKFLGDSKSFNNGSSICWEPHLGIVFLENNIAVNYISVCMECNKLKSMIHIPAAKTIISTEPNGINIEKGMTPAFRQFLNSLLTKYNFKYANRTNYNIWDRQ